jgi:hypothetical protein
MLNARVVEGELWVKGIEEQQAKEDVRNYDRDKSKIVACIGPLVICQWNRSGGRQRKRRWHTAQNLEAAAQTPPCEGDAR